MRDVIKSDPYNAETPAAALASALTKADSHYVRSNFPTPSVTRETYALAVTGTVRTPLQLDWQDLVALPQHALVVTMECAGNDRLGMRPIPDGEPWASGALSTAPWQGVRLRDVLERAGLADETREIVVEGADYGPRYDAESTEPVTFARSSPLHVAMDPDTLLATHMHGQPLTPRHGAPVRLIVPGWYGMANVKWVARLVASSTPFTGYFQTRRYVYEEPQGVSPVTRMRIKSMIVSPLDGATLAADPCEVQGWAWSGTGPIARVQIAVGGGDHWQDATLGAPAGPHAWTPWRFAWSPTESGRIILRSRATDASGAVQPDVIAWNVLGYGNNAVRAITVQVREAGD